MSHEYLLCLSLAGWRASVFSGMMRGLIDDSPDEFRANLKRIEADSKGTKIDERRAMWSRLWSCAQSEEVRKSESSGRLHPREAALNAAASIIMASRCLHAYILPISVSFCSLFFLIRSLKQRYLIILADPAEGRGAEHASRGLLR